MKYLKLFENFDEEENDFIFFPEYKGCGCCPECIGEKDCDCCPECNYPDDDDNYDDDNYDDDILESIINEKNVATNSKLWNACKAWAKSKYDVWPSAYACGAAAKRYKSKGGKWKKKKSSKK